jgi:hypothetical protein
MITASAELPRFRLPLDEATVGDRRSVKGVAERDGAGEILFRGAGYMSTAWREVRPNRGAGCVNAPAPKRAGQRAVWSTVL